MNQADPLVLGPRPILPADVVDVAIGRPVWIDDTARRRMADSRAVIETALEQGTPVYGVTTGVGALQTVRVRHAHQDHFNRSLLISHSVGHGEPAPPAFVRAAMLVRAAGLALGVAGVRPAVADAFCAALNAGVVAEVHMLGSVGQADLSQMAEIGLALTGEGRFRDQLRRKGLEPLVLEAREAHAIVNSNAFSTGIACLALDLAQRSVAALDLSAALSYEAVRGNIDALHPAVARVRPYPGLTDSAGRLRRLLDGGGLASGAVSPRRLQDALCFKGLSQTHGATRDALTHLADQLAIELASSGDSPLVILDERRAISTGNHEIAPLAIALDYARLGLAQSVTVANERIQKLLDPQFTDLPSGLRHSADSPEDDLAIVGHGASSVAAEARLLAWPVTLEQPTSGIAEGIEDRITMAPTAADRLYRMSELTLRLAAIEMVCAARAVDLRDARDTLGAGTAAGYAAVRVHVPPGTSTTPLGPALGRLAESLAGDAHALAQERPSTAASTSGTPTAAATSL